MFEFILAGFSGSIFSYLVAMECGILFNAAINESSRITSIRHSNLIHFKMNELREELLYMLNDVKLDIKNEIKSRAEYNSKNSDNTSQTTRNNVSQDSRHATVGNNDIADDFSEGSDTYEGSEFFEKKSSNSGYSGERSSVSNESNDELPKKSKLSLANLLTLDNEVKLFLKSNYKYPINILRSELSSVSKSNQSYDQVQKIITDTNNDNDNDPDSIKILLLNYIHDLNTNDDDEFNIILSENNDLQKDTVTNCEELNNDDEKNNLLLNRMISDICLQQLNRNVADRKILDNNDRHILENLWKRSTTIMPRHQINIKDNSKPSVEFVENENLTNQSGVSSTQNSKQSGGSSTQNSKQSGGSSTQKSKQSGGSSTQNSKQSGGSSTQNSKQNDGSSTPRKTEQNIEFHSFMNNSDRLMFISNHTPTMDDESMKRIVGDFN